MSLEWAHAECLGQREGLVIAVSSLIGLWGLAPRRNFAQEAQGIRLVRAFLTCSGECQCALGEGVRLLQAAGQQMCFPQGEATERLEACHVRCRSLFHRLREQRHSIGDASGQGIRCPQGRSHPRDKEREVRFLTDAHGPFEPGKGSVQVALAEEQETDSIRGPHETAGVRNCFRNLQPFFPERTALSECAQLSMARGEEGKGLHIGQIGLTEAFTALCTVEGRHGLPEAVDRLSIATLGPVCCAKKRFAKA